MGDKVSTAVIAGLSIGIAFVIMFAILLTNAVANADEQFRIMMKRSTGDCVCPGYRVGVDETGWVIFEGYDNLAYPGKHRYPIEQDKVKELMNEIEKVGFFNLKDEYGEYSDGTISTTITIALDGKAKTIYNYDQETAGAIFDLENRIDEILETKRWVYGEE